MHDEEAPIDAPESGAFDLVVLGTGLVEALVAGCVLRSLLPLRSCARCGAAAWRAL